MEFQQGDRVRYIGPKEEIHGAIGTAKGCSYASIFSTDVVFDDKELNSIWGHWTVYTTNLEKIEDPAISVDVTEFL